MCGVAGLINKDQTYSIDITKSINNMVESLKHRGPDSSSIWINDNKNIAIGHSRLSILDLSMRGSQPMFSSSKRFIISYNGEIYNHLNLRKELSNKTNINWKSNTDTETLLECIEYFGLDNTLGKISGMFAFCFFDQYENKIYLVRDKIGEKPIYYGYNENKFVFSSEITSLVSSNILKSEFDINSINMFLKYQYVPSPYSIYKNIFKLKPGSYMEIDLSKTFKKENFVYKKWWNLKDVIINSKNRNRINEFRITDLKNTLENSVNSQMISDVPIGSFLSGGIDSSIVTAIMNKYSEKKLKTFTIGLEDAQYNEAKYAKKIAKYFNTDHHEYIINEKILLDNISNIIESFDEPFADSSQIPTYLLSKFAKKSVSVVLTGDGGDEFFGGYNRYLWSNTFIKILKIKPFIFRYIIGKIINISPNFLNTFIFLIYKLFRNNKINVQDLNNKLFKFAIRLQKLKNPKDLYLSLLTEWTINDGLFNKNLIINDINLDVKNLNYLNEIENMMYNDALTYLPDDILYKVDRSSMQHSLETRAPFLDSEVIETAWAIPFEKKIDLDVKSGKNVLKNVLNQYLPKNLYERPKMGFSIPVSSWFRGNLKEFTYDTLLSKNLFIHQFFDKTIIRQYLDEHVTYKKDWQYKLWSLVVFQIWSNKKQINF